MMTMKITYLTSHSFFHIKLLKTTFFFLKAIPEGDSVIQEPSSVSVRGYYEMMGAYMKGKGFYDTNTNVVLFNISRTFYYLLQALLKECCLLANRNFLHGVVTITVEMESSQTSPLRSHLTLVDIAGAIFYNKKTPSISKRKQQIHALCL